LNTYPSEARLLCGRKSLKDFVNDSLDNIMLQLLEHIRVFFDNILAGFQTFENRQSSDSGVEFSFDNIVNNLSETDIEHDIASLDGNMAVDDPVEQDQIVVDNRILDLVESASARSVLVVHSDGERRQVNLAIVTRDLEMQDSNIIVGLNTEILYSIGDDDLTRLKVYGKNIVTHFSRKEI
jgi:hypothetical protein